MRLNYTSKTAGGAYRELVLLGKGFVIRRVLLSLLVSVASLAIKTSAEGDTLAQVCQQLDKYDHQKHYQTGMDMCRATDGSNNQAVLTEEDPLVQEKYLYLRANLCQGLADKYARSPENHRVVSEEALRYWEAYFQWLKRVGSGTQSRISNVHVWVGAAALGTTALSAKKAEDAWVEYESFEKEWFGSDGLDWWVATLVSPDWEKPVSDTIFATLADKEPLLRKAVLDAARTEHWRRFAKKLPEIIKTGRFTPDMYDTFLGHLNAILPPNTVSLESGKN
jgi:hypothetical protein